MERYKVLVLEFHQESNSFSPIHTVMADYERCSVLEGETFLKEVSGKPLAPSGMFDVLKREQIEITAGYGMRAPAGGVVEHEVVEYFLHKVHECIEGEIYDGVLVSLHGATQSTKEDDVCGLILEVIRQCVGRRTVIAASLDLHANITERMYQNADILCGYQTYPHVDVYTTGVRAASLAVQAIKTGKKMKMSFARVPMIVPACGYSTEDVEIKAIYKEADGLVEQGVLADYSIFFMQPWLDVKEGSGMVITIGEEEEKTSSYAKELAEKIFNIREQAEPELDDIDAVIKMAEKLSTGKPVIMVDFSDSTNAGAAGDGVYILERILALKSKVRTAYVMNDRPAVEAAFQAGVGAEIQILLGKSCGSSNAHQVAVCAKVRSLHDGDFILEGPSMRGAAAHIGRTALLSVGEVDIVVCQAMASTGDPQLYRHFGIEPTLYQLVVVKANTSYRAAYEKIAEKICIVDTKGAATADLKGLPFRKLSKCLYPFNQNAMVNSYHVGG